MVDETDIRIGNLVWYYDLYMVETIFRVEGILEGNVYSTILPKSKIALQKVNPIVLDIDHLMGFGFLPGEKEYGEDENVFSFRYNHKDSIYIRNDGDCFQPLTAAKNGLLPYGRPLVHVHQLQNLCYDLTREEIFLT
ncbi:hypothetical protein F0L74_25530 [Chitinophaga agrisoli]|uniref:Uncharacterized protein n=1 Tax=Chitinophaga agrisoli TaxID=2607653 RepID=A0A5B2VMN8_9BACT|nr:hypothetical protein [Chitinophaga agrisoli]KAA2239562.1 hypothetical protein F0L74_25530 [Chitinophaga agrisoli]